MYILLGIRIILSNSHPISVLLHDSVVIYQGILYLPPVTIVTVRSVPCTTHMTGMMGERRHLSNAFMTSPITSMWVGASIHRSGKHCIIMFCIQTLLKLVAIVFGLTPRVILLFVSQYNTHNCELSDAFYTIY